MLDLSSITPCKGFCRGSVDPYISMRHGLRISVKLLPLKPPGSPQATPELPFNSTVGVTREHGSVWVRHRTELFFWGARLWVMSRAWALVTKNSPMWGFRSGRPWVAKEPRWPGEGGSNTLPRPNFGLPHRFPLYNLDAGPSICLILILVWNKLTLYNTVFIAQFGWVLLL